MKQPPFSRHFHFIFLTFFTFFLLIKYVEGHPFVRLVASTDYFFYRAHSAGIDRSSATGHDYRVIARLMS